MTETRKCPRCNKKKLISSFNTRKGEASKNRGDYGKPYGYCKPCSSLAGADTPYKFFSNLCSGAKRRCKHTGLEYALDKDALLEMYKEQRGRCALSGRIMTIIWGKGLVPSNMSLDRIDNDKGYTMDNIRLTCRASNWMRNEMSDEDLKGWCEDILGHLDDM